MTIEDGVYNLLEVKIESMFDNGKGRMIQRSDIFFSSCGYAEEFGGFEDEHVNRDLEGEGVGCESIETIDMGERKLMSVDSEFEAIVSRLQPTDFRSSDCESPDR